MLQKVPNKELEYKSAAMPPPFYTTVHPKTTTNRPTPTFLTLFVDEFWKVST
jgi:hypothetical protein